MKRITKELYNNLEKQEIDIKGQKLKYRGLMVFMETEDKELEKAIEESGKLPYLIVTGDEIPEEKPEPEKDPEEADGKDEDIDTQEAEGGTSQVNLSAMKNADLVEYGKLHFGLTLNIKDKKNDLISQINKAIEEAGKVE